MKKITIEEMYQLHYKDLQDEEIRNSVIMPLAEHCCKYVNLESIARKVLETTKNYIPPENLKIDPRLENKHGGYLIPERGAVPSLIIHPQDYNMVNIAIHPCVKYEETLKQFTDPIENIALIAGRGIVERENVQLGKLLSAASENNITALEIINLSIFKDIVEKVNKDFEIKNIIMHDEMNSALSASWQCEKGHELIKLNKTCDAKIHNADEFKKKVIYLCGEPEKVGTFTICYDVIGMTAHDPCKLKFGWVFAENIGMLIKENAQVKKIIIED